MDFYGGRMIDKQQAEHYTWGAGCDASPLVRDAGLSVIEERMPPHTAEIRHAHHRARQFFWVLAGVATFELDGQTEQIGARQGIEVPPGVADLMRNDSTEPLQFLVISTPPSHGDRFEPAS